MPDRQQRSVRRFLTALTLLLTFFLIFSALFLFTLKLSGVVLIQYEDGTVMLGQPERSNAVRPKNELPPATINIIDVPRPTVPITTQTAESQELTFNEIYKKTVNSVTVIISESRYGSGSGTGIVMSADGYIITNNHVVEGAEGITVILHDGTEYEALLVGYDRISDLAVIKVSAEGLSPAEFGNSDTMEHGDPVCAIGNPLGIDLRNTITSGIISGVNRDITIEDSAGDITMSVLQTNCAVNPGNSGGPLLNQYGQVIGIISSKIMSDASQTVEGLGFAIPSNTAAPLIAQLIEKGYVKGRPALGITVDTTYTESMASFYGLPPGIRVAEVKEYSDAYAKGLQTNDIITHVNGIEVRSLGEVNNIKNNYSAGDTLTLTVYRMGESFDIEVMLLDEGDTR